jgi:prevent-host-death family protein
MIQVDAFEAQTHLSDLLNKVSRGEEVLITRRGKAVARLVPVEQADRSRVSAAINELLTLREEVTLNGADWKTLRDQGKRR